MPSGRGGPTPTTRTAVALVVFAILSGCSATGQARPAPSGPVPVTTASGAEQGQPVGSAPGAEEAVLSAFLGFGDFGGGEAQVAVARAMERWLAAGHGADALVSTGDNVYEVASPELFGPQLDAPYRNLRRSRPLWATLGNHDVAGIHGPDELTYLGLPALPYTEELAGVQLLFLDANHPDEAQARWLDQRLGDAGPRWRVVVFHQPAYSCGLHGSTEAVTKLWVPVIEAHHVALVLNGHDHDYERFRSPVGVTYVVTGGGGQTLYPIVPGCRAGPVAEAASAVRHHFVAVEVRVQSLTLTAVADDGSILDRAVLP